MRHILVLLTLSLRLATGADIYVDALAGGGGDGTRKSPFRNLKDGVDLANSSSGNVTIWISAGDYLVAQPIKITRSIALKGTTVLADDASGLPTGGTQDGTATRIIATGTWTVADAVLTVGRDGDVLNQVEISGLWFDVDPNLTTVHPRGLLEVMRVKSLLVGDSIFHGKSDVVGLGTYAASGRVTHSHFSSLLSGAAIAGGYPGAKADITFDGNRSTGSQNGLLLVGTSDGIPEDGYELVATVRGNDLSRNVVSSPAGAANGLRLIIKGNETIYPSEPTARGFYGRITAVVMGNTFSKNTRAVEFDAGFAYRRDAALNCDPRPFTGLVDATFQNNFVEVDPALSQKKQLITFTRLNAYLNPAQKDKFKYLRNATFTLTDVDGTFGFGMDPSVDDPETDGSDCTDSTLLNNTANILP